MPEIVELGFAKIYLRSTLHHGRKTSRVPKVLKLLQTMDLALAPIDIRLTLHRGIRVHRMLKRIKLS